MAKKKNHVSVAAWERIAKELCGEEIKTVDWHGESLEVKTRLSLAEVVWFVNQVIKDCFGSDMTEYHPEVKQFAIDRVTIAVYTNVTLPVNMEKQYELIAGTDIIPAIHQEIDAGQYGDLLDAIDEKIDSVQDTNTALIERKITELASSLDSVGEIFSGISSSDIRRIADAVSSGQFDESKLVKAYFEEKKAEQTTKQE